MFSTHIIYIQSLCGQHTIKIQLLILRFEFWYFQKAFKIFAIKRPFYIMIKHVEDYIYLIHSLFILFFHFNSFSLGHLVQWIDPWKCVGDSSIHFSSTMVYFAHISSRDCSTHLFLIISSIMLFTLV
jgi:hypothetical protein